MFAQRKTLALLLGTIASLTPLASAGGVGISFEKYGKHSGFGIEFSTGIVAPAPAPSACLPQTWIPGHYDTVLERVWVEGSARELWCAPVFEWRRDACGRTIKVLVVPGHWQTVSAPGHEETRRVQLWQPGHWESAASLAF
jgi:hypothetical protein